MGIYRSSRCIDTVQMDTKCNIKLLLCQENTNIFPHMSNRTGLIRYCIFEIIQQESRAIIMYIDWLEWPGLFHWCFFVLILKRIYILYIFSNGRGCIEQSIRQWVDQTLIRTMYYNGGRYFIYLFPKDATWSVYLQALTCDARIPNNPPAKVETAAGLDAHIFFLQMVSF